MNRPWFACLFGALFVVASLNGCSDGAAVSSRGGIAPSETVPPPLAQPDVSESAASDVIFTVDESISISQELPSEGGQVQLDVPGGGMFSLVVPDGAFFEQSTSVTMQSIVDTQGLPPGLIPIAAVNLGPSGADFAVQPMIEIDLRTLPRPVGNIVLFLANDDGTELTYLLPLDEDLVASALGNGPYRAFVPHFSGVGVAVSDPNGPGVPTAPVSAPAEIRARQALNERIDEQAREVLMGLRVTGSLAVEIGSILEEWRSDIRVRAERLFALSTINETKSLVNEYLRFEESKRNLVREDRPLNFEETEIGLVILRKLGGQIDVLNDRCMAGNANALVLILDIVGFLGNLASIEVLDFNTVDPLIPLDLCRSTLTQ